MLLAERKEVLHERPPPFGGAQQLVNLVVPAVVRFDAIPEQLEVAHDDGEQVVEVVRDAARQLADRFELLRLTESMLELPACALRPESLVADRRPHGHRSGECGGVCRHGAFVHPQDKTGAGFSTQREYANGNIPCGKIMRDALPAVGIEVARSVAHDGVGDLPRVGV